MIDWAYIIDRLPAVGLGVVIGYGLSTAQDWFVARFRRPRGEDGETRLNFQSVALFVIVVLVAYAAIASQKSVNDSKENSRQLADGLTCIATTTFQLNNALVERSTKTANQTRANVKLQQAFSDVLGILLKPGVTADQAGQALREYYRKVIDFVDKATEALNTQATNPFPVPDDLISCLHQAGVDIDLTPKNENVGNQNTDSRE